MKIAKPITVDILTPSYNQGRFLRASIESIRAQHYPFTRHIVIDGGSTDETLDVLAEYGAADNLCWISEKDGGLYEALNKALDKSQGDVVGWLNCDDLYEKDSIKMAAAFFERHADAEVVCGDSVLFSTDQYGEEQVIKVYQHYQGSSFFASRDNLSITHLNACFFRRSFLKKVGYFDQNFRILGDRDYMFRIMAKNPKSGHLGRNICRYRSHDASLTMASVNDSKDGTVVSQDHPQWEEMLALCKKHIALEDSPPEIRGWCKDQLIKLSARKVVAMLRSDGEKAAEYYQLGSKCSLLWYPWFIYYLAKSRLSSKV